MKKSKIISMLIAIGIIVAIPFVCLVNAEHDWQGRMIFSSGYSTCGMNSDLFNVFAFIWCAALIYVLFFCHGFAFLIFLVKRQFKGNRESDFTGPVEEHMSGMPVDGRLNQNPTPVANGLLPLARARRYHRSRRGVVASNASGRERYPLYPDLYIDRDLTCGEEQAFFNDFGMHPDSWMEVWCPMREMTMEQFIRNCSSHILAIIVTGILITMAICTDSGGFHTFVLFAMFASIIFLIGYLSEVKVEFMPPDEIKNPHDAYAARYALFVGYRRALRQAQESGDPMGLAGILQNALTRLRFSPPESYYRFVSWSPSSQPTAATPSPFDSVHVPFEQIHKVEPVADLPPTHPLYVPESESYTESVTVRGDKVDDFVSDLISASVPFKPYGSGVKVPTSHLSTAQMLAMKYQF